MKGLCAKKNYKKINIQNLDQITVLETFSVVSIQIIPVKLSDSFVLLASFVKITITPIKIFWSFIDILLRVDFAFLMT